MIPQKNNRDAWVFKILLPLTLFLSACFLLQWGYRFGRWLHQLLNG